MHVEIGTEAVQFLEKKYINGIFLAVYGEEPLINFKLIFYNHADLFQYRWKVSDKLMRPAWKICTWSKKVKMWYFLQEVFFQQSWYNGWKPVCNFPC